MHLTVVIRQKKPWRRIDGIFVYFEDNAGVIVNDKGEMKGSWGNRKWSGEFTSTIGYLQTVCLILFDGQL